MGSHVRALAKNKLVQPPDWLLDNIQYECFTGSIAYGVATDTSDRDVCGFCIPPKGFVFPHLAGEIIGFGKQHKRFEQWQVAAKDNSALGGRGCGYDIALYSIVRYLDLCLQNNPNMLDTLFVPQECILHITAVGQMVREKRRSFLHKGAWHRFKGFAYSQLHKMNSKERTGKRKEIFDKFGFDVKFAYNTVRLLYEAEMILTEHDIDLRRHSEHLKAIRRGDVPAAEIISWAAEKEKALERLYETSTLPWGANEPAIKQLLLDCLEHHYGSLSACVISVPAAVKTLGEIQALLDAHRQQVSVAANFAIGCGES